ncbi:MAG: flagellar export chaperone FliS [Bryobacteraceae bacterium]
MSINAYHSYLENKVLGASPMELVQILYDAAIDATRVAERCLAAGDIEGRSRQIGRVQAMLCELSSSLDREAGGDLAVRLARLYDYMQLKLTEANVNQTLGPIVEVRGLLATLAGAWREAVPMPPGAPVGQPAAVPAW